MPRCSRIRTFIQNYNQSPRANKLSFFLPYLILAFELIVLIDALLISNLIIVSITIILVTISVLEIIFVTKEIHNKIQESKAEK